jgi:PAS domain S-box-containing protein
VLVDGMHSGNITVTDNPASRSEDPFQQLLLRFSAAAAQGSDSRYLIRLFCRATREFFGVSGAYFWEIVSPDEMVGAEADGLLAERFRGTRVRLSTARSAVAVDSIRQRQTLFLNNIDASRYPLAAQYGTKAIMSAPLVVAGEVIGAAAFIHDSDPEFFNDDLAAKATILAGQLGSLLETLRLTNVSREEQRRAEVLAEVATALHSVPGAVAVMTALAERLQGMLRNSFVAVLLREGDTCVVRATAGAWVDGGSGVHPELEDEMLRLARLAADRAVSSGESLMETLDSDALGKLGLPSGQLLTYPFRTSITHGAVVVFPRAESSFSSEERTLLSTVVGFGAVAIANAELYATASSQSHELHQLVEISSQLGSIGNFDLFMERFVERAAAFLGFHRAFLALQENGTFEVRWGADEGKSLPIRLSFPQGPASRAVINREVFWTDDAAKVPGANLEAIAQFHVKQVLCVPLPGSDGQVLGMLGVLDRKDGGGVSQEDIRRAKALAAEVAVALQVKRNLHLSEEHRRRAEALMSLALETSPLLHLPDFAQNFVAKAATLLGAGASAMAIEQDSKLETVVLGGAEQWGAGVSRRLSSALSEISGKSSQSIVAGPAAELVGSALASTLGWNDLTLAFLHGADKALIGVLCLANRRSPLNQQEEQLLKAMAGHTSVALENARLFSRMEQANRHWVEIFDSISDFIVVHDEQHRVLRVNHALADFIGVRPPALIGISMGALLTVGTEVSPRACPFCRNDVRGRDEFVQSLLERSYLVSTSRIHSSEGESLQTVHVLKDITDRREAERRYRELFDNIQEGLFFTSSEGRFVEVNDALVRMLGYDRREELLQADISAQIYFTQERRRELSQLMEQNGMVRNYHATLRRREGTPIHVLINAFAVRDAQGKITQIRGLMLDITDLKNFQSELQRERDFSSKILNNTQSLILVADTAGLISYGNRRWYEAGGYQSQELLGHPLAELIAPSRRQAIHEALLATLSGQQVDNLELPVMRADGRTGQFSVNLSPMRDDQGHVSSIVVVMTDITDAAMLQAKLMHTEKMAAVGQLVSGVAHEVNNPLTAILGFADLLMENPAVPVEAKKDLRVILHEAQRTKQIVQNLLSFARQMPPQRRPLQINTILSRTIQLRAYDFSSHGIEIVEHFHSNLPEVIGDSHQLQQVFLNIINNAYDAVRETGRPARIEIMTSSTGGFAEISFRDNGHGIAHPERIFDPFFTTKEVGKGTGLGLSICYGIVREHAGEIFCHNNEDGPGATFIVRLPAISETATLGASVGVVQG